MNYDEAENTSQSHIDTKFGLSLEKEYEKVGQLIFTGHCKKLLSVDYELLLVEREMTIIMHIRIQA